MESENERLKIYIQHLEKEIREQKSQRDELITDVQGQSDNVNKMIMEWLVSNHAMQMCLLLLLNFLGNLRKTKRVALISKTSQTWMKSRSTEQLRSTISHCL